MNNRLGDFIKNYRVEHGLSLREMGKRTDISHTHIDSIERGSDPRTGKQVKITNETLTKLSRALHVDPTYLFELSLDSEATHPARPASVQVPVLGEVVAGIPIEAVTDILDYEEISAEMASTGEFFGLRVKGESMQPKFSDGDVIIVRQQSDVESGDFAVVMVNSGEATFKKIQKTQDGIMLISLNASNFPPKFFSCEQVQDLPVRIIGKCVELRAKF